MDERDREEIARFERVDEQLSDRKEEWARRGGRCRGISPFTGRYEEWTEYFKTNDHVRSLIHSRDLKRIDQLAALSMVDVLFDWTDVEAYGPVFHEIARLKCECASKMAALLPKPDYDDQIGKTRRPLKK